LIQSGGVFEARLGIGGLVKSGDVIGWVGQTPVLATTAGIVRGLIHAGVSVQAQLNR
jgi:xanthine dehydrogenase accessory factor